MRIHWDAESDGRCVIDFETGEAPLRDQLGVFLRALALYDERNEKYKDNWRRFGWRGCLFRLRERVERLWDYLWDYDDAPAPRPDVDDAIDLINFAAFTVRAVREGNRDGSWWSQP